MNMDTIHGTLFVGKVALPIQGKWTCSVQMATGIQFCDSPKAIKDVIAIAYFGAPLHMLTQSEFKKVLNVMQAAEVLLSYHIFSPAEIDRANGDA